MKRIHLPVKNPAKTYHPKPTVTSNQNPTGVQLKQLRQQDPVQFQQDISALQNMLGNEAVVQLLHQLEAPPDQGAVHHNAAKGVQGSSRRLPHYDKIQRSFGKHDISRVQAYTGKQSAAANAAMGARAYATGKKIAFAESNPDLHTVAHEAAHVIQQQAGVQLKGGVGRSGDKYERHADRVADIVVRGQSAQAALDTMAGKGSATAGSQLNVQAMMKTKVGEGMEGADKEDKGGQTATATVSKFELLIAKMIELLESGPVFIGENHMLDYGSNAVLALIKSGKVKKVFLELPPFRDWMGTNEVINPIKTEDQYQQVKFAYENPSVFSIKVSVAKRFGEITERALQNKVEVYHSDVEFTEVTNNLGYEENDEKRMKKRNKHTSEYIAPHLNLQLGAGIVVIGGAEHYSKEEYVPIHKQLGYGNENNQQSRFFNLAEKGNVQ